MTEPNRPLQLPPITSAALSPLYQQIIDGLKSEISRGRLRPGQPLPSFRALAGRLMVSLITVKRAYQELEREGIVYCRQGQGTFVSENGSIRNREIRLQKTTELLREALAEAAQAGLTEHEILELARKLTRERKGGGRP